MIYPLDIQPVRNARQRESRYEMIHLVEISSRCSFPAFQHIEFNLNESWHLLARSCGCNTASLLPNPRVLGSSKLEQPMLV